MEIIFIIFFPMLMAIFFVLIAISHTTGNVQSHHFWRGFQPDIQYTFVGRVSNPDL